MSSTAFLRLEKLKGPRKILAAARHNRREFHATQDTAPTIDTRRTHLNRVLHGPATARGVADHARNRLKSAGIKPLRKDAVVAIEVLFSLPVGSQIDPEPYFDTCWRWVAARFGGVENVLSVDVHLDEAAPHCHLLIQPLKGSRLVGSDMVGGPRQLAALQAAFGHQVAAPSGLAFTAKRLDNRTQRDLEQQVLQHMRQVQDKALQSDLWSLIRDAIKVDPKPYAELLGIGPASIEKVTKRRTMAQIFTSPGKGPRRDQKPIGFANESAP